MAVDAARAVSKYLEYRQKLAKWAEYFEEDVGRAPTEEDRRHDASWTLINSKVFHYKRLAGEESMKRRSRRGQSDGSNGRRVLDTRLDAPLAGKAPVECKSGSRSRHGGRDHDNSPSRKHRHRPHGARGSSSSEARPSAAQEDLRSSSPRRMDRPLALALPPIPKPVGRLVGDQAWAIEVARAQEALKKCKKWERAFEREQGEPPTEEARLDSNTYGTFERRYLHRVAHLQRMVTQETAASAQLDDSLGATGADNQPLAMEEKDGDAAAHAETILTIENLVRPRPRMPNNEFAAPGTASTYEADDIDETPRREAAPPMARPPSI